MMKGLCITFTWTSLFILSELQCSGTNLCLHDIIDKDPDPIPEVRISGEGYNRKKLKRHVPKTNSSHVGKPIRIHPAYFLSKHISEEEKLALQNVVQRALAKIQSLLSVIKSVDNPLILERKTACPMVLRNGTNKGKCSRIKRGYVGEYCLDEFKIPSSHLKGLAVFKNPNPEPVKVYKTCGEGLNDTDFVLYVTAKTTPLCNPYKSSALAYAAACQLDESGRPIAGQVNFCPRILKKQKFDGELLYKTAIHELFHALGFSRKLFEKFVSCDEDGKCSPRDQPLVRTVKGIKRLVTPAVKREMRRHFECEDEADFGGPLQTVNDKVSSHWHSVLMHSSIMTAREQKPHLTLVDPITLAVFEDSGWYTVDYSQADPFVWGKDKGCEFGVRKKCIEKDGLCSNNSTGCHHLRLSKAKCNALPNDQASRCGVFAADQTSCFLETNQATSKYSDETFSATSRCFLSSLAPVKSSQVFDPMEVSGRCYESKCEAGNVYIRIQNGEWDMCPPGSKIQVDGFSGFIECPHVLEMCTSFYIPDIPGASLAPTPIVDTADNEQTSLSQLEKEETHLYSGIKFSTTSSGYANQWQPSKTCGAHNNKMPPSFTFVILGILWVVVIY